MTKHKGNRTVESSNTQAIWYLLPNCLFACLPVCQNIRLSTLLAICLSILHLSCQQSPLEKEIEHIEVPINPITISMPSLEKEQGHLFGPSDIDSNILLDKTADIFLFSEGLMELGVLSNEKYFTELGHKVILSFYNHSDNYTSYTVDRTPYVKVALGIKDITSNDDDYQSHSHDHNKKLGEKTIATQFVEPFESAIVYLQHKFDNNEGLQISEGMTINEILEQILNFLDQISESINSDSIYTETEINKEEEYKRENNAKTIANDVIKEFKKEIINVLQEQIIAIISNNNLDNLDRLEKLKEIFELLDIEELSKQISDTETFLKIFLEQDWDNYFNQWLESSIPADPLFILKSLTSAIKSKISFNINTLMDDYLNNPSLIQEGIQKALYEFLSKEPMRIENIIISYLENRIDEKNIYDSIHEEAKNQAKDMIFKDKETLPGIEFSNIQIMKEDNNIVFSTPDHSRITDGVTLGTAMSVLAERLNQFETFEKDLYDRYNNHQLLFSLFNKSLSIVGHYTKDVKYDSEGRPFYGEVLPLSFFRPLIATNQGRDENINIYNYYDQNDRNTQRGYFAIPDKIILEKDQAFKIDLKKTQQEGKKMTSSALSQAELIRGASKILKYLRPDKRNDYDKNEGMGQLEIMENTLFRKLSFFNLHFGITGVLLTNLQKTGIYVYKIDELPIHIAEWDGKDALKASVHDIVEADNFTNALSDNVKTIDMARLMIAVEEFIPIFEELDIDQIESNCISELSDQVNHTDIDLTSCIVLDEDRKNYKMVTDSLETIKTLNLGLHSFITTKLQRDDGCFINSYNVKSETNDGMILLDTQIQTMLALTDYYRNSREGIKTDGPQSGSLQGSILKGFNCLTKKLFDSQNAFYIIQEGTNQRPHLRLTTDILRLFYKLDVVFADRVNEKQELAQMRTQWTQAYIEQLEFLKNALEVSVHVSPSNENQSLESIETITVSPIDENLKSLHNYLSGQEEITDLATMTADKSERLFTFLETYPDHQIRLDFNKNDLLKAIELLNDGSSSGRDLLDELNTKLRDLSISFLNAGIGSDILNQDLQRRIMQIIELATTESFKEESSAQILPSKDATYEHTYIQTRYDEQINNHVHQLFILLESIDLTLNFNQRELLEAIELLNNDKDHGNRWLTTLDRLLKKLIADIEVKFGLSSRSWWSKFWQEDDTFEQREQRIIEIIHLANDGSFQETSPWTIY